MIISRELATRVYVYLNEKAPTTALTQAQRSDLSDKLFSMSVSDLNEFENQLKTQQRLEKTQLLRESHTPGHIETLKAVHEKELNELTTVRTHGNELAGMHNPQAPLINPVAPPQSTKPAAESRSRASRASRREQLEASLKEQAMAEQAERDAIKREKQSKIEAAVDKSATGGYHTYEFQRVQGHDLKVDMASNEDLRNKRSNVVTSSVKLNAVGKALQVKLSDELKRLNNQYPPLPISKSEIIPQLKQEFVDQSPEVIKIRKDISSKKREIRTLKADVEASGNLAKKPTSEYRAASENFQASPDPSAQTNETNAYVVFQRSLEASVEIDVSASLQIAQLQNEIAQLEKITLPAAIKEAENEVDSLIQNKINLAKEELRNLTTANKESKLKQSGTEPTTPLVEQAVTPPIPVRQSGFELRQGAMVRPSTPEAPFTLPPIQRQPATSATRQAIIQNSEARRALEAAPRTNQATKDQPAPPTSRRP